MNILLNPILKATGAGFSAKKLLDFFIKQNPNLGRGIQTALASGYTAEKILSFLQKPKNFQKMKEEISQKQIHAQQAENPLIQAEEIKKGNLSQDLGTRLGSGIKAGLGTAAQLGTAYMGAKVLPSLIGSTPPPEAIVNKNQHVQPPQQLIQEAKQPSQILPVPTEDQSILPALPVQNPKNILDDMNLTSKVDNLFSAGNAPEQVTAGVMASITPGQKEWIKKQNIPLDQVISEYVKTIPQGSQNVSLSKSQSPQNVQPLQNSKNQISQEQANPVENKNFIDQKKDKTHEKEGGQRDKGSLVLLPNNELGTVIDVKKDHAVVNVDGKKRPVKLDEIQDVPIKEKDLSDLHQDLITGIEKSTGQPVSRNVEWAGYEPNTGTLAYMPWDGALYTYENISPEDAKILTGFLTQRKSTGENFIGAWEKGSKSPIGSAMYALIKRLQSERGGKGKEYSGKFQTIYKAYEPAIKAAKEKKKNEESRKNKKQS